MTFTAFSALGRYNSRKARDGSLSPVYDRKPDRCPYCRSRMVIRHGHVGLNRRGRYLCKKCGHTFSGSFGTPHYRGRLGQHVVRELLDLILAGTTVIGSSVIAGVNKNTSLRYRHRLLSYVRKADGKPVLSGKAEVDETYVGLSGRTKGTGKKRGISSQKEGIAIGTDVKGRIAIADLRAGHPTAESLRKAWKGRIREGTAVIHDRLRGYRGVFGRGRKETAVKSTVPKEEALLADVNRACSGLKWFLRKHRGITKKYLGGYLAWYELVSNLKPGVPEFEETVFGRFLQKTGTNT